MSKTRKEDVDLAPQQWRGFNQPFYSRDPTSYFSQRLSMLALVGARRSDLEEMLAEGVRIGTIQLGASDDEEDDEPSALADHERPEFIADVVVLFHHTVESMLRMYLAHLGRPDSPRLQIARMRTPGAFKSAVQDLIARVPDLDLLDEVADVCYGVAEGRRITRRVDGQPLDLDFELELMLETWNWFVYLAKMWLDEAALYNAAKHGFCIDAAASSGFWVGDADDPALAVEGAAITYLDLDRTTSEWVERRTFVDVSRTMTLTFLAIRLARQVWSVGKTRYTDEVNLSAGDLGRPTVGEFLAANPDSPGRKTWSMSLVYLQDESTIETEDGQESAHPAPEGRFYRPRSVTVSIPFPTPWVLEGVEVIGEGKDSSSS
jgi:hypothetical protein